VVFCEAELEANRLIRNCGRDAWFWAAAATHDRVDFQPVPARSWKISEQDKQELARLQVRNRRLEALVTAMRERANRR